MVSTALFLTSNSVASAEKWQFVIPRAKSAIVSVGDVDARGDFRSSGSGFIVSSNGDVLTAEHVVGKSATATVRLTSGRIAKARVIARAGDKDLAHLRVAEVGLFPHVDLGTEEALEGEPVLLMGYPRPDIYGLDSPTSTQGIISAKRRDGVIQIDVQATFGSSGGPVLNCEGEAIGVLVSGLPDFAGGNLAISIDTAKRRFRLGPQRPQNERDR